MKHQAFAYVATRVPSGYKMTPVCLACGACMVYSKHRTLLCPACGGCGLREALSLMDGKAVYMEGGAR